MNEKNKTMIDGNGRDIIIKEDDFKFVQKDAKIHDVKFNKKPTTFFKDSMKRFAKSKSALTGGIIVGLLVLGAIFVPTFTPDEGVYNVATTGGGTPQEADLSPKLFPAGTGFWDGTVKRSKVIFDENKQMPVGYNEGTYFNLKTYIGYENSISEYGRNGLINVYETSPDKSALYYTSYFDPSFIDSEIKINYEISDETYSNYQFFGYKLYLFDGENKLYLVGDENNYSKELTKELNVKETLVNKGYDLNEVNETRFEFELAKSNDPSISSSMLLKNFNVESTSTDLDIKTNIEANGFKDANTALLRKEGQLGYWKPSAYYAPYKIEYTLCDFTFDQYANVYGIKEKSFGARELILYEDDGSLEINLSNKSYEATTDKEILKERFKILTEDGVFVEIIEQVGDATYNAATKRWTGYSIRAKVNNYKILGYDHAPIFIFGTNDQAKDYLKLMFTGMRFSFLLAVGVSAVNIMIGLIWGSISGYFGGWTDIIMERFCDILAGLPSTVIITLCILYGRDFKWGSSADVIALMLALFMTGWMGVSARTRTQFYRYKGREYVLASRTLGAKDARLIFRHILPNASGTIITGSILMIPSVIYTEASIAYLGLGLQGQVLFGVILTEARSYYSGDKAFLLFIPTFIMMLLLVSFNLFGNGLRDAFNPTLKGGEK